MKQSYHNVTLHRGGGTEKEGGRERGREKGIYEGQALLL